MNFKWNSHQLNTYIYLSASVIDFRKQYDQLLVICSLKEIVLSVQSAVPDNWQVS